MNDTLPENMAYYTNFKSTGVKNIEISSRNFYYNIYCHENIVDDDEYCSINACCDLTEGYIYRIYASSNKLEDYDTILNTVTECMNINIK